VAIVGHREAGVVDKVEQVFHGFLVYSDPREKFWPV
jgi:hypothetical protein